MLNKHEISIHICLFLIIIGYCSGYFGVQEDEYCFCQLQGRIDDCSCNVDTVDHFNNVKVYPRLRSLLTKNYFRFYKVNLKQECPFWIDDSRCAMKYCHVEHCQEEDIPPGLKGVFRTVVADNGGEKYSEAANNDCEDHNAKLGYLNMTISAKAKEDFELWTAHDAQDNFCDINEWNHNDAKYVDLLLNPERYTGYRGKSAHRIWHSIYMENCFRPRNTYSSYIHSDLLNGMCIEKRAFYRAISGLHTSINIHLCAKYLLSESGMGGLSLTSPNGEWGPNLEEFKERFSPENTNGEGPHWLRNLYFLYLLEIRALAKASPYLEKEEFYTGDEAQDWDTQLAVKDLLSVVKQFPPHFNESVMFNGGESEKLKYEFKQHFRNITRIMDCVGCDKCKVWGKLQVQGLGTALKILFSGKFDNDNPVQHRHKKYFQLERTEIVSLINSIGRLSTSIYELDEFRQMLR